jgi:hypothetical protein
MNLSRLSFTLLPLALMLGCAPEDTGVQESAVEDQDDLSIPCPQQGCPAFCAVAEFDGPAFYAKNFYTYDDAKEWVTQFSAATDQQVLDGPCAAPIACPDYYDPFCGVVSGAEPQTFGNECELLAATRQAAGSHPPGEAKGAFQHEGECAATNECDGQACGTPCEGPFASPLPTACDGQGACVPQPSCGTDDQCVGQPCGTPCEAPFASPLPTACDGQGACVPQPTCDQAYDCDLSGVLCDIPVPECPEGQTLSAIGACYGPCVPVTTCKCDPSDPADCPEGYVCWASTERCGPYVN